MGQLSTLSFRAECMKDVELLGYQCKRKGLRYVMNVNQDDQFPDVEVEMTTHATLPQISEVMRLMKDGHVMLQTLRDCPLLQNPLTRNDNTESKGNNMDYIDLEKTTNRVVSALKAVTDPETSKKLDNVNYALAELRHAAVSLEDGVPVEEVKDRLMATLFSEQLKANQKATAPKM